MHWTLTQKNTNDTLTLDPQFDWADEFDWQPLAQSDPIYTITGAMIIETGIKQAGRPITLNGDNVWLKKSVLDTLFDLSQTPIPLSLNVPDGRVFDVLLKKIDKVAPITAYQKADETGDDYWRCDILFITL